MYSLFVFDILAQNLTKVSVSDTSVINGISLHEETAMSAVCIIRIYVHFCNYNGISSCSCSTILAADNNQCTLFAATKNKLQIIVD